MTSALLMVRLNVALIATLLLAACGGTITAPSQLSATPIGPLAIEANALWHLRSIASADQPVLTIEDPLLFTLLLTDNGKVSLGVDCNRASGGYTLSGQTLSIGQLASTMAYCTTAATGEQFLMLLGGENTVAVSDATLQLSSPRGTLSFSR